MRFPLGVFVDVQNSGLPLWQEVPLTFLGCGIAYGLIFGVVALVRLPGKRRLRRRVHAVEAAAGDGPVYASAVVCAAGPRLFGEVQAGWDARDRDRLAHISDPRPRGVLDAVALRRGMDPLVDQGRQIRCSIHRRADRRRGGCSGL
jgi:hypothetical protein